jgi:soluble lytic murein transglycosylase
VADELMAIERQRWPDDSARLLFELRQRAGPARGAGVVARSTLSDDMQGGVDEQSRPVWEAMFPRPFRRTIERHAKKASIDPDLLQGLIRQESRFNAYARSSSGALGLAQLMPATARKVARSIRFGRISERALLNPNVNVRLGASYLRQLLDQFDGVAVHSVAAYNAGPIAVQKWIRKAPQLALDEWVEEIPYDETRNYVKNVMANYGAYQLVYGAPAGEGENDPGLIVTLPLPGE